MDDSYHALQRAIVLLQLQLALLPIRDSRRDVLHHDLHWCYHEAFTVLERRKEAHRAGQVADLVAVTA